MITFEAKKPFKQVCDGFLEAIAQNQPYSAASEDKAAELVKILGSLIQSIEKQGQLILTPDLH